MNEIATPQNENDGPDDGIAMRSLAADTNQDRWAAAGCVSVNVVAEWTEISIDNPTIARQWAGAGFTAESASAWIGVIDMTPNEAATCAAAGMTPVDVERIRRADPTWTRPQLGPETTEPSPGIGM